MAMTIPTIPTLPAGYVVTANDMNNLAYAATFLLAKPVSRVHDAAGTQTVTTSYAAVAYNTVDFDPDGMWSSGSNTRLTVQTPGFYKVSYNVDATASTTGIPMSTYIQVTTGANNPLGSGVAMTPCWGGNAHGGVSGAARVCPQVSGIIPWYMYAGDYAVVMVKASSAGMTLSNAFASSFGLELVSI